ncbi:hypothetical protein L9F63_008113, partial [Diploptera punctata]
MLIGLSQIYNNTVNNLMERLMENPKMHFDVRFTVNRFTFFVMHRALDIFVRMDNLELIYPSGTQYPALPLKSSIKFINPLVECNPEQSMAVKNIVLGTSRPAPYIIHGPPGTGKTVTIVEAILQVKKVFRNSFILVCASSNAACDLLAQKLVPHCTTDELLRLHSTSRDWETVPADLHQYSNRDEQLYWFPTEQKLLKYRIIVCTLINSGRLLPKRQSDDDFADFSHFTHVFIDESGQATEPETLVPIAGILGMATKKNAGGQVILAGDHLQLGPVCSIKHAGSSHLKISLMERLIKDSTLYERGKYENGDNYNNKYITKLCRNFRSHELILYLPNKNFYEGDLILDSAEDSRQNFNLNLSEDPKANLPVVFHGVLGQEKREGRSPSYFNDYEIQQVMKYVSVLLEGGPNRDKVKQEEVGIIAPYIRQVYKIKGRLKEKHWENIEVGTTETFQGREKRVIIISTVRGDEKRFNVAVTRARSLLIVVGNPFLLETDENWGEFISFTIEHGSYRGCPFQSRKDPEWIEAVKNKLLELNFKEMWKSFPK